MRIRIIVISVLMLTATLSVCNVEVITNETGLSLRVDQAGEYELQTGTPQWRFLGSLGQILGEIRKEKGNDKIGAYEEIVFVWNTDGPMSGGIRLYTKKPLVLFSYICEEQRQTVPPPFPNFRIFPEQLYGFSYHARRDAPHRFSLENNGTPWLLFDEQLNAVIISPADNFMVAEMKGNIKSTLGSGLIETITSIPPGFTHKTLMTIGHGINHTWDMWGQALTDLHGKKLPENDANLALRCLGYWNSAPAPYWYNYDMDKGYGETLAAVIENHRATGIPTRYLQLDSWWYQKSLEEMNGKYHRENLPRETWNCFGGFTTYRAHPSLFPDGLEAFHKKIGLPLVTHSRWMSPYSDYHKQYETSGLGMIDIRFWEETAEYLKRSGVVLYEQDWPDKVYNESPEMHKSIRLAADYMDNMAKGMEKYGMPVEYFAALPRQFLNASRLSNVIMIRSNQDRFEREKWTDALYSSRLIRSVGAWPHGDNFFSSERDNLWLQTLFGGTIGPVDALGEGDKSNLLRSVRSDGVIVKPDIPIVPADNCYIADASGDSESPMYAWTYTKHGELRTVYVFVYARHPKEESRDIWLDPASFGYEGDVWVYDCNKGHGEHLSAGNVFQDQIDHNATRIYQIAPVARSGICFLGDPDKFVSTGKKRITSIKDDPGRLTVTIAFAENERKVKVHGYAKASPVGADSFDSETGHFTIEIAAEGNLEPELPGGELVRLRTILLQSALNSPR